MAQQNPIQATSGTFNTLTAGQQVSGSALNTANIGTQRLKAVSARVAVTAATSTITLTAKWQVSLDNSTWFDVANGSQNAAGVVLATGTSAIVTKVIPAPECIYAYTFARIAVVVGVTTGAAGDLYAISYAARQVLNTEE